MSFAAELYDMLKQFANQLQAVLLQDLAGFKQYFPNYYWLPYFIIRLFPFVLLLLLFAWHRYKKK